MKRTKLFFEKTVEQLESAVNKWLADNREANVLDSNMDAVASANDGSGGGFTFYLLIEEYHDFASQQVEEMKATIPSEGEPIVTDINFPEVPGVRLQ